MKEIIGALEEIEKSAKAGDRAKVEQAIQSARSKSAAVGVQGRAPLLRQLDEELSIWLAKLNVIFKEPVGREGVAKHARHWAEELRKLNVR